MIYIATHKKFNNPQLQNYCPIHVGAARGDDLGYERDDLGENISSKNPNYCELTGLYWIWKNSTDPYKGLVHYRRYFGRKSFLGKKTIYSYDVLVQLLKDGNDIILPKKEFFLQSAKEYMDSFENFFNQNKCSLFNMMFCKAEYFDQYCNWLFDILFELEGKIDLVALNNYQKRIFGFLSERLLNVWVSHNHLQVKYMNVINTEMTIKERVILCRRRFTNRIRYKVRNLG